MRKSGVSRVDTPGLRYNGMARRSCTVKGVLSENSNNLQAVIKDSPLCKTPTRRSYHRMKSPSPECSSSESSEEIVNTTVISQETESDIENFELVDIVELEPEKKKPSTKTDDAWHRQMKRLSMSIARRQSDTKFLPANKFDFTKEKTRRSCMVLTKPALNNSLKFAKMDRRSSFKLPRETLNQSQAKTTVKEVKPAPQTQGLTKKPTYSVPKITVPSIVNTNEGIQFKQEEVLHFGIPVEAKKKNTKVVPFSFESRNKELQLKKEQRLKKLKETAEQKEKLNSKLAKPTPSFKKKVESNTRQTISFSNTTAKTHMNRSTLITKNDKNRDPKAVVPTRPQDSLTSKQLKQSEFENKELQDEIRSLKCQLEEANKSNKFKGTNNGEKVLKLEQEVASLKEMILKLQNDLQQSNSLLIARIEALEEKKN